MDETTKEAFNWQRLLITTGLVLATAAIVGGGIWYFMNQNEVAQTKSYNDSVASLQKQIDTLNKKVTAQTMTSSSSSNSTTASSSSSTETNDQIFNDVSTQLKFSRSEVTYFRIWGQDKVQYSLTSSAGVGGGTAYAYKENGSWIAVQGGQAVNDCSVYSSVPEQYRPICTQGTSSTLYYAASDNTSLNYPISSAVHYIGQ